MTGRIQRSYSFAAARPMSPAHGPQGPAPTWSWVRCPQEPKPQVGVERASPPPGAHRHEGVPRTCVGASHGREDQHLRREIAASGPHGSGYAPRHPGEGNTEGSPRQASALRYAGPCRLAVNRCTIKGVEDVPPGCSRNNRPHSEARSCIPSTNP